MKKLPKFGELNITNESNTSGWQHAINESIKHPVIAKYGIRGWDTDNSYTRDIITSFAVVQAYLDYFNSSQFERWLKDREEKLGITIDRSSAGLEFYGPDGPTKVAGVTISKSTAVIPEIVFRFEGDIGDEEIDWSDMTPKDVNGFKLGVGYTAYPDSGLMHVSATYF
jgi:hypothetical protein